MKENVFYDFASKFLYLFSVKLPLCPPSINNLFVPAKLLIQKKKKKIKMILYNLSHEVMCHTVDF